MMMQDLSGQKLGQYELRERLGRGGMAEVYKAYQPGMDRFVAVKVMLGHLADDEGFITRFKREAQSVGKLRHPHIVNVFDFGVERNIYFMVMEYIEGDNLKHYIQQRHALPLLDSLKIASQIADALDYAHNRGMIHRDLKPANIMFADKQYQHAVLTDFGIARLMGQSGLTASGAMVGTPAYISPEAARGESVDERADLYGLGIILYEMLTGKVPYDADTPLAVIMKHINAPLPTPRDYGREVPPEVEKIVVKSLTKMPADRYQTAAEMKTALHEVISRLPEISKRTPAPKTASVSVDDDRTMIDSMGGRTVQRTDIRDLESTLPPAEKRRFPFAIVGAVILLAVLGVIGFLLLSGGEEDEKESKEVAQSTSSILIAATSTPTETSTAAPPTETLTATDEPSAVPTTVVPPTETLTPVPTTAVPPTETFTPISPTETLTATPVPPTATLTVTPVPTTAVPPTEVVIATVTSIPAVAPPTEVAAAANSIEMTQVEFATVPRQIQLFPIPADDFVAETHFFFVPAGDFEGAGLYVELADNSRIEFVRAYCTPNETTCVGSGVYLDYLGSEGFNTLLLHEAAPFDSDEIYLRLTRTGATYTAEYRGQAEWQTLAQFEVPQETLQVGIVAQSASEGDNPNNLPPAPVNFVSFTLQPSQEIAAVPSAELSRVSGLSPIQDEVENLLWAGDFEQAMQTVNTALDANPDDLEALAARSMLYRRNGDTDLALADADRIIELAPENPLGYIARADILYNWPVMDYPASLEILETAWEFSRGNPHVLWRMSRARTYADGNETVARDEFNRAVELGAQGMDFYLFAGEYLFITQDYEKAEPYLRMVHNSFLRDEYTMLYLAGTLVQLGRADEGYQVVLEFPWGTDYFWGNPSESFYGDMAFVAFKAGEYEQAREWARDGMALSDAAYKCQHIMGLLSWYADGDLEQALAYLDPLMQVEYSGWPYFTPEFGHTVELDRARILAAAGESSAALDAYTLALENNGEWPDIYEGRAALSLAAGDTEAALSDLRRAFDLSGYGRPDLDRRNRLRQQIVDVFWGEEAVEVINPPAAFHLTESDLSIPLLSGLNPVMDEFEPFFLHDDPQFTLGIINDRLAAEPDNIELLAARVMIFIEIEDMDAARADADRIIELAPDNPLGYLMHFQIASHWSVDDPAAALENATRAYELAPNNPEVLWRLAWAYMRNDKWAEAASYYDLAERAGAKGYRYGLAAGMFWYDDVQYERAVEPLKTFLVADPDNLYYGTYLLAALIQTGQTDLALQIASSLTRYADNEPDAYSGLAYVAYRAGNYPQAKAWAQVALALSQEDSYQARYVLALLKWEQDQDLNGAIEALTALEGSEPNGIFMDPPFGHHLLLDMARIYTAAGEYQAAVDTYTRAIEQDFSSEPFVYELRADVYLLMGNPDAAREDLRQAVERTEDEAERERLFERILELGPE